MAPTPPKRSFNWSRFSKTLSFWILVILIPVAVIQFSNARGDASASINYTQYLRELERGNVI
ncbi:MAG TPA: hypothetical protein VH762_04985, partial [Gemmatimonadaceae bacterium]